MTDEYKNMRILIVDDFEMIRITIKQALVKLQVQKIDQAKDGTEALEKIRTQIESGSTYDLVFCDWNMPKMTGIELLGECKKHLELSKIPFIMVTSESEKGNVLEAIKLGAADYVVKPFAVETIEKKLQKILKMNPA